METLKGIGLIAVISLVVSLGVTYLRPATVIEKQIVEKLGATPGNVLPDEVKFGDVGLVFKKQEMRQATSTVCALRSPTYATSTLIYGSVQFRTGSTSADILIDIAKGASGYATTTLLGSSYLLNNGEGVTIQASTSPGAAARTSEFTKGQYFTVNVAAPENSDASLITKPTGFVPVGSCNAIWVVDGKL